jgi:hypothetical protein
MAVFPWAEDEHESCLWIQQVIALALPGPLLQRLMAFGQAEDEY